MQCRTCGTEIADKAIVCYRCGAGTSDPVRKAVPIRRRRSALPGLAAAAVLMLLAFYARSVGETAPDPEPWQMVYGVLLGAASIVIVRSLLRWRR